MLDAACNGRCGCASRTGLLVTEVSKSWRTLWKRWPIYRCVAVTNDSTENADEMSRSVERAKNTAPHPSPASGRGRVGGRHMPFARRRPCGPVLVLRAEEPRPRIADYVAPLVVERTTRPIAARTSDRISPGVGGIGNVAWRHRIGRICRVRNRTADDGARSKATENAQPHAAAATARISVVGTETAASANTPAAAIAVIVVFMFLPRQGMIALRSFDCTQVFSNHVYPSTRRYGISRMPPSRRASLGYADSGTPTGI